jgi:beta-glucosidase
VTTTIRNAGSRAGEEVAQLYLNFPDAPGAPRLALRGFQRVALKPGETREVSFALSSRDLSSVDLDGERRVSAGRYRVSVGSGQPDTGVASRSADFAVDTAVAVAK